MFGEIANLLISTVFYLAIFIAFLRFLFQLLKIDFYNPISQFVVKASNPVLNPIRQILPSKGKIDWASLLAILILKIMEVSLKEMLFFGTVSSFYKVFSFSVMGLTDMLLNFYLFIIFAQIILSWLAPYNNNPAVGILYRITEPVMAPARKIIPPMGGLDLSPILILLGIQILDLLLLHSQSGLLPVLFGLVGKALGLL